MKLIFIYGLPASGKLTVAKELSKMINYKIFHNHLTVDLVSSIFEFGTDVYVKTIHKYRLDLIEAAARENIKGLIFTYYYNKNKDDEFVKKIVGSVERHGSEVCFVQLHCSEPELIRRVKQASQKNYRKIKSVKLLKEIIGDQDVFSSVSYARNLKIDNTKLSAKKAAKIIKDHFNL
jgi:tRNA uridine 5-carbamoylmethylation protein Kti12